MCNVMSASIDDRFAKARKNVDELEEEMDGAVEEQEVGEVRLRGVGVLRGCVTGPDQPFVDVVQGAVGPELLGAFLEGREHACLLAYGGSVGGSNKVLYGNDERGKEVSTREYRRWGVLQSVGVRTLEGARALHPDGSGHAELFLSAAAFRLGKVVDLLGPRRPAQGTAHKIGLEERDYTFVEGAVSGITSPCVVGMSERRVGSVEELFQAVADARKALDQDHARLGERYLPYQGHVVWLFTLRRFDFAKDEVLESRLNVVQLAPGLVQPEQLKQTWGNDPWAAAQRYESSYMAAGPASKRKMHPSTIAGIASYELRQLCHSVLRAGAQQASRDSALHAWLAPTLGPDTLAHTEALRFFSGLVQGAARVSGLILLSRAPGGELENQMAVEVARAVACLQGLPVRPCPRLGSMRVTRERVSRLWHAANKERRKGVEDAVKNAAKHGPEEKYRLHVAASRANFHKQRLESLEHLICSRNLAPTSPVHAASRPGSASPRTLPFDTPRGPGGSAPPPRPRPLPAS